MNNLDKNATILVAGGGGFIGGHLVKSLLKQGYKNVRSVDCKPFSQWYQRFPDVDNRVLDLRGLDHCLEAVNGCDVVYNLAADMGGMGFIENNKALCMLSVLINTHLLMAGRQIGIHTFFYASSACVYAGYKQKETDIPGLKEGDAYPADPEDGYGWEKLFSERMCRHFYEDFGIVCHPVRFHNVYGPFGTWDGGREKAPAAICRKVLIAKKTGNHNIEIWGDGLQTRSFMYIDDCIEGMQRLMNKKVTIPINLGSSEMVSINQLVDYAESIVGIKLKRHYNLDAPKGVRGRSSDNTLINEKIGWEPATTLREGLEVTCKWIEEQMDSGADSL